MHSIVKYSLQFDQLSDRENHDLSKAVKSVVKFIESSSKISDVNYATRDAHAKTYATVKGNLEISTDLPDFITDLFRQKEYKILARFSNGNLVINKKGRENPLYGFSIKIKDVNGSDANFTLVNFPLFPTNSPSTFLKMFTSVNTFLVTKQDNFVVSIMDLPSLLKNSLSLVGSMFSKDVTRRIFNLLSHRNDFFFSFKYAGIGCYRFGDHLVKLSIEPEDISSNIGKKEPQKNSIHWFLSSQESSYNVMVELCENLKDQPVNDLMKDWKNAPKYCLGKLTIPKASLVNSEDPQIENLNFDPFENDDNLQPVGKIQQIRKKIYEFSISTRNRLNNQ